MRHLKLRNFLIVALAIMLVLSVIGCGKSNSGSEDNTSSDQQETTTPEDNTATTDEPAETVDNIPDLGGDTIKIGSWWDGMDPRQIAEADRGPSDELAIQLINDTEKKYNVKIEFVKFGDYGKYVENLTTTALSGEPFADIVALELFWSFPTLVNQGFLAPIDDQVDVSDKTEYTDWLRSAGTFQGHQYGYYDGTPSPFGLIYNKTLVQKLGLPDPYELQKSGEWTWEKFRQFMKDATKDTNGDGKTDVWGLTGGWDGLARITENFLYANQGAVTKEENGQVKFNLDSPNSIEALSFVSDIYNVDKTVQTPPEGSDPFKEFTSQNGVMVAGFNWNIGDLVTNMPDQELGYVFFPKAPQANGYTTFTPYGNMFFVVKQSKHADIAMKIYDEISLKSKLKEMALENWKQGYPTMDMVDTRSQMYDTVQYSGDYLSVPDGGTLFSQVIDDITKGKIAPSTAVDKVKGQFEGKIAELNASK
ncbi:extracellular solute-binding protein [Paenibacillus thermotolerans]|uniref:extracellular solute-binding protein n=1 Tax=Paenibacillus thermotolerans TaxID=3027807 RepID=UPI002367F4DA|nr:MULTISPECIES: extracellular solute-binding protein [unclassified Paenibacillus]